MRKYSFKEKIGCTLLDLPRLLPALLFEGQWISARNREEKLLHVENGGVDTSMIGNWSKDIHACHVFPWTGRKLLKMAAKQWPFRFSQQRLVAGKPRVSFVLPHRGVERLPLLTKVIQSIFGQEEIPVECIVVEQGSSKEVHGLPSEVKYIHLPHPVDPEGWRKSWALNVGVSKAESDVVVCHDGDILVPMNYCQEILKRIHFNGYEVAHLQRFLFCLSKSATRRILSTDGLMPLDIVPERVRQNWQGGTVAITRKAFTKIGGYDESFVGWGGEDNEFYDRCTTLRNWKWGYLPFCHLWHQSQIDKVTGQRKNNLEHLRTCLFIPRDKRIKNLSVDHS